MPKTFKKSALSLNVAAALCASLSFVATPALSSYQYIQTSNTDFYEQQIVSSHADEREAGDLETYNNPNRNLSLYFWTASRTPKAIVHDADLTAQNVSISSSYRDAVLILSEERNINISGNEISLSSEEDAVLTKGNGSVSFSNFKNLKFAPGFNRDSQNRPVTPHGTALKDEGAGISVLGTKESVVTFQTYENHPDPLLKATSATGGIKIQAGKFWVPDSYKTIHPLNFAYVSDGATIEVEELDGYETTDTRNTESKIGGLITATKGGKFIGNFNSKRGHKNGGYTKIGRGSKDGLIATEGGTIEINLTGDYSQLIGSMRASGEGSSITVNSTGQHVRVWDQDDYSPTYLAYITDKAKLNLNLQGFDTNTSGDIVLNKGAEFNYTLSQISWGSILLTWENEKVNAHEAPTANDNTIVNIKLIGGYEAESLSSGGAIGNRIAMQTSNSKIHIDFLGKQSSVRDIDAVGYFADGVRYGGNLITLNFDGDTTYTYGTLTSLADNRIVADVHGKDSFIGGKVVDQGDIKLRFAKKTQWQDGAEVSNFLDETGKLWSALLDVEMQEQTVWGGTFTQTSGTSLLNFNNTHRIGNTITQEATKPLGESLVKILAKNESFWEGDFRLGVGENEVTFEQSKWKGNALLNQKGAIAEKPLIDLKVTNSSWEGDLSLTRGKATAVVAASPWTGSAVLDNLEGKAATGEAELDLRVEDTTWDGALNIAQGSAEVSVKDSTWKRGITMANSRFNSFIEDELQRFNPNNPSSEASEETPNAEKTLSGGDLALSVSNTKWTGDVNITNGNAKVELEKTEWEGDVTLDRDLFTSLSADEVLSIIYLHPHLVWRSGEEPEPFWDEWNYRKKDFAKKMPLLLEKVAKENVALQSITKDGTLNLALKDSSWTGDLTVKQGEAAVALTNSTWAGDFANTQDATTLSLTDSSWKGKAESTGAVSLTESEWHLTADSEVAKLSTAGDSAIFLEGEARTLKVNDLEGDGTFVLDFKYKDDNVESYRSETGSDFLLVKDSASGSRRIVATPESDFTGLQGGNKLYFATSPADDTAFNITAGISKYVVQRQKLYNLLSTYQLGKELDTTGAFEGYNNWFLTLQKEEKKPNENSHIPGAAHGAAFALWRDNDTLLKRLGEIRDPETDNGLWVRLTSRKMKRSVDHAIDARFTGVQFGYDRKIATATQGDWVVGAAFAHASGKPEFDNGAGSGKLESNELTAYATNLRENGHTIDVVGRVGRINSEFSTVLGDKAKFDNWAASLGVEYGKRWTIGSHFSIEPQAQLTYHYLWGDDYQTQYGINVHQANVNSLVGRLGVVTSFDWARGEDRSGSLYAKASVMRDFLGKVENDLVQDITLHDTNRFSDTWYVLGLGTNVKLGKNWRLYFDAETSLNAEVKTKYNLNAGVHVAF